MLPDRGTLRTGLPKATAFINGQCEPLFCLQPLAILVHMVPDCVAGTGAGGCPLQAAEMWGCKWSSLSESLIHAAPNKASAQGLLLKRFVTGLMASPSSLEPPELLGSSNYLNVPVRWEKIHRS